MTLGSHFPLSELYFLICNNEKEYHLIMSVVFAYAISIPEIRTLISLRFSHIIHILLCTLYINNLDQEGIPHSSQLMLESPLLLPVISLRVGISSNSDQWEMRGKDTDVEGLLKKMSSLLRSRERKRWSVSSEYCFVGMRGLGLQ